MCDSAALQVVTGSFDRHAMMYQAFKCIATTLIVKLLANWQLNLEQMLVGLYLAVSGTSSRTRVRQVLDMAVLHHPSSATNPLRGT